MAFAGLALFVSIGVVLVRVKRLAKGDDAEVWDVLRESLLGSSFAMPQTELTDANVEARWQNAAQSVARQAPEGVSRPVSPGAGGGLSYHVSSKHHMRRGDDSEIHVMFGQTHLRELRPASWKQQVIGKGSYGVVFRATWRGQQVAVKELNLPEQPDDTGDLARDTFKKRVQATTESFVQEVSVCCDLAHPNLVRMLGYSAKPTSKGEGLLLEFPSGKALDAQLYVEGWRPTPLQVLKAAIDIARGVEYLHTAFEGEHGRNPIMHRDLKSPNLLLASPPPRGAMDPHTTIKITDFGACRKRPANFLYLEFWSDRWSLVLRVAGLTRDKEMEEAAMQTGMMTGCGSVLWMAPEILLAGKYNEKIDVFSYAMCLVELVDGRLPWSGLCSAAEVPHKVTRKTRPQHQLKRAEGSMAQLIKDCWHHNPSSRPTFKAICERLEEEAEAKGLDCGKQVFIPRTSEDQGSD